MQTLNGLCFYISALIGWFGAITWIEKLRGNTETEDASCNFYSISWYSPFIFCFINIYGIIRFGLDLFKIFPLDQSDLLGDIFGNLLLILSFIGCVYYMFLLKDYMEKLQENSKK